MYGEIWDRFFGRGVALGGRNVWAHSCGQVAVRGQKGNEKEQPPASSAWSQTCQPYPLLSPKPKVTLRPQRGNHRNPRSPAPQLQYLRSRHAPTQGSLPARLRLRWTWRQRRRRQWRPELLRPQPSAAAPKPLPAAAAPESLPPTARA
jgi:hypothetical protein